MKMKTKPKMVWLVCGLVALTAGCQQNELDFPGGKVLKAVIEGGQTKVSFDNYEGKFAWTPDDQLAVYYSDGTKSIATVATDGTVEVPASTASRYRSYYAVYPASVVEDITDGSQPLVVTLPIEYDISDIVANASGNPGADFSPLPMVAQNDEDNDILMFYHVGGLLRITLKGVKVGTKQVYVMFDKGVTGSFAVSNPGTDHPTITAAERVIFTNDIVKYTVDKTDEGIRDSSKPIVLNVPVPCGTYNTVTVMTMGDDMSSLKSQTYDGDPLTFKRHHGKRLSFGDLTVDFEFGTDNGSGYFVGLNDAEVEYTGGDGSLSANFVSYKTDGTTEEPVPFTLEYSEDGGTTWNTSAPSWLTPGTIDLGGSTTGQPVIYTAAHQVDTWENPHPGNLRANGTHTEAFDLSKYNVATNSITDKSRTANCYVVDRPGSYKFPLVYGNGIDWEKNPTTGINEDAYRSREGVTGAYRPDSDTGVETNSNYTGMDEIYWSFYIGRFRDHLDQYITSPYIATQQSGKSLTATLVWEDVQGLVTDVQLSGSGEDTYLTFRVPSETIDQGNALVAVLADGKIAWSWHIWVTEEDLTVGKAVPSGYLLAPVNLGWCDGKEEYYAPRTCLVRATQEGTGNTYTATFTQTGDNPKFLGNNPFYEWGRKDPMQAGNGNLENQEPKTYYPFSEAYAPQSVLEKTTLGGSIQNPFVFYSAFGQITASWCSTDYINLWSNNFKGIQNIQTLATVSKTVYDPSPVGYHVPPVAAFDGFTTSNLLFRRENGIPGWFYDNSLLFPVTGHILYVPTQPSYTGLTTNRFYSWTANSTLHHGTGVYAGAWRESPAPPVVVTNTDGSKDVGQAVRPVKD